MGSETVAYLLAVDVECRHDDMAGSQMHQLQDTLAQVGLHHIDTLSLQVLVEVALLGEHALALDHLLHAMRREDIQDDGIILVGILCPVDMDAVCFGTGSKLLQIVGQMGDRVFLYLAGSIAQLLPLGQCLRHLVALLPHSVESGVVACGHGIVLQVSLGLLCM